MPKNVGISGQQWAKCDRCGFVYPIGSLSRQLGLSLCNDRQCMDDLTNMRRPQMIASKLGDGQEFQSELAQLVEDPGEIAFDE